jgi:hypothetical protein
MSTPETNRTIKRNLSTRPPHEQTFELSAATSQPLGLQLKMLLGRDGFRPEQAGDKLSVKTRNMVCDCTLTPDGEMTKLLIHTKINYAEPRWLDPCLICSFFVTVVITAVFMELGDYDQPGPIRDVSLAIILAGFGVFCLCLIYLKLWKPNCYRSDVARLTCCLQRALNEAQEQKCP